MGACWNSLLIQLLPFWYTEFLQNTATASLLSSPIITIVVFFEIHKTTAQYLKQKAELYDAIGEYKM